MAPFPWAASRLARRASNSSARLAKPLWEGIRSRGDSVPAASVGFCSLSRPGSAVSDLPPVSVPSGGLSVSRAAARDSAREG